MAKKKNSKGFKQTPGGGCDAGLVVSVQVEAVQLIADGKAPRIPQTEEGASYEGIQRKSNAKVRPPGTLPSSVFEAAGYFFFAFAFAGCSVLLQSYCSLFWKEAGLAAAAPRGHSSLDKLLLPVLNNNLKILHLRAFIPHKSVFIM